MFFVIKIQDNLLNDVEFVGTDRQVAQDRFIDSCRNHLTNFDEYTQEDIDALHDEGYAEFTNGSICLMDTDGPTSDFELRETLQRSMDDFHAGRGSVYPAGERPGSDKALRESLKRS